MRSRTLRALYAILPVFLLLQSCKYSTEYTTVSTADKFSLSVPSWLKEDKKLKPGAEFQFANRYRNFYAIGEALPKGNNDLSHLMKSNLDILKKSMKDAIVSDSTQVTIDGLNGVRTEIFGKMNDENIYFSEVVLEGKNNFYHLSVWTRGEDRKLKFKEEITRLINSFKGKV